ncbi:MAG TPA: lysophospholipid acyltransferase family protein [Gammaproteobacteria bacterium]
MIRLLHFAYGCYAWVALLAIVIPLCVLLAVVPGLHRRRRLARGAAQLFLLAIGSPVRLAGSDVEPHYPCVVVANHSSYLDGIILTAALPAGFTYLIKHQMSRVPIAGFLLRRLGSAFVDRDDRHDRHRTARALYTLATRGAALGFFPEGTFDKSPGLKPFHLGAFSAAARANLPVVPVVIHGARWKLPSGRFLPRPGPLLVHVCEAVRLPPDEPTARALMAQTRRAMLEHLDEPDLASAGAYIPE